MVVRRVGAGMLLCSWLAFAPGAAASVTRVVQPGETLSGIAAVNGIATASLAAFNGISPETYVIAGHTIEIPAIGEVSSSTETTTSAAAHSNGIASAPGMGHIDSPWGPLHLDPAAADSWNAMADAALAQLGVDLHPAGTVSAYRTYEEQAGLYSQYLAGTGAPANPPGTSSHELGVAVDVATPEMRSAIDQIGPQYGWYGNIPSEWWHVAWGGY